MHSWMWTGTCWASWRKDLCRDTSQIHIELCAPGCVGPPCCPWVSSWTGHWKAGANMAYYFQIKSTFFNLRAEKKIKRLGTVDPPEEVIGVVSGCMQVLSSSFIMSQLHCRKKQVRDGHNLRKQSQQLNWPFVREQGGVLVSDTDINRITRVSIRFK